MQPVGAFSKCQSMDVGSAVILMCRLINNNEHAEFIYDNILLWIIQALLKFVY
jgi:hypothetical protein